MSSSPSDDSHEVLAQPDEGAEQQDHLHMALRDLRIALAANTYRVASIANLNDSDLAVLDVLTRQGPQSPTTLARRTGIHAATMTGILARLERSGWITRHPNVADRRAARIEATGVARLTDLYRDANRRLDDIANRLSPQQAGIVLDYLHAVTDAVHAASEQLSRNPTD